MTGLTACDFLCLNGGKDILRLPDLWHCKTFISQQEKLCGSCFCHTGFSVKSHSPENKISMIARPENYFPSDLVGYSSGTIRVEGWCRRILEPLASSCQKLPPQNARNYGSKFKSARFLWCKFVFHQTCGATVTGKKSVQSGLRRIWNAVEVRVTRKWQRIGLWCPFHCPGKYCWSVILFNFKVCRSLTCWQLLLPVSGDKQVPSSSLHLSGPFERFSRVVNGLGF